MPNILTKHHYLERGGLSPLSSGGRTRRFLLPLALVLLAFYPVLTWYFARITDGSDEPYGIIALALAAYFVYRARTRLRPAPFGYYLAAAATLLYALTYPHCPPLLRALLAVFALTSATGILRTNPGTAALLALSLPLIASLQFFAGYPLRILVASSTSGALNFIGLDVTREGTLLDWGGRLVAVDAPCSGVNMLWAACALAAALATATSLTFLRTAALLFGSVLLIIAANILRGILLFFKESGAVPLPSWTHPAIGVLCFALAALLLTRLSGSLTMAQASLPAIRKAQA